MATWPAYGTLTEHADYHAAHGNPAAWRTATDAAQTEALRLASEYLDVSYRWTGRKLDRTQVRDWPRVSAYDHDDYAITGIPQALKDATSYLALRVIEGDTLLPDLAAGELQGSVARVRRKVEGLETETEYQGGATQSTSKRFTKVDALLRNAGLVESSLTLERG
jgi:hypothetical protein